MMLSDRQSHHLSALKKVTGFIKYHVEALIHLFGINPLQGKGIFVGVIVIEIQHLHINPDIPICPLQGVLHLERRNNLVVFQAKGMEIFRILPEKIFTKTPQFLIIEHGMKDLPFRVILFNVMTQAGIFFQEGIEMLHQV